MRELVSGGAACSVPGSSSSSNPLGALANAFIGSSSKTQAIFNEVEYLLDDMIKKIKEKKFQDVICQMDSTQTSSPVVSFVDIPEIIVCDPNGPVCTKGRPRGVSRFQSGREVAQEVKSKPTRYCGEANHYMTTCPKLANQHNKDNDNEKGNKGKDKTTKVLYAGGDSGRNQ